MEKKDYEYGFAEEDYNEEEVKNKEEAEAWQGYFGARLEAIYSWLARMPELLERDLGVIHNTRNRDRRLKPNKYAMPGEKEGNPNWIDPLFFRKLETTQQLWNNQ